MLVKVYARIRSFILTFVFLPNPPKAILKLPNCLGHEWLTVLKRYYWLVRQEYNRHVVDEGPHFCINQNKNIDND